MSGCACCDEIVDQLRQERLRANRLQAALESANRMTEDWRDRAKWHNERGERYLRSNASLRGALTKAKKKIAELREEL